MADMNHWIWNLIVEYYRVEENLTVDEAHKKVDLIKQFVRDRR